MSRLLAVLGAFALMSLATAASASAESLNITAKPAKPNAYSEQVITVDAVADQYHSVSLIAYDVGTPCGPEPEEGNRAIKYHEYPGHVPEGSSSKTFKADFWKYTVADSHLCGYMSTKKLGTYTVTDAPLKRWGDVAGYNVRTTMYWIDDGGRGAFRFIVKCSEGTVGFTADGYCQLAGHIRITISDKLRKRLDLKSRTILEHGFKTLDKGLGHRVDWAAHRGFAARLRKAHMGTLPVRVTLESTAPLSKTVSGDGNLMNGNNGVQVATYPLHSNEEG